MTGWVEPDYSELRVTLSAMTARQLRTYAREHLISLADAHRKAEMVDEICTCLRHQAYEEWERRGR